MYRFLLLTCLLFISSSLNAQAASLLEDMMTLEFMQADYDVKKTDRGIEFHSKEKLTTADGRQISKTNISLNGPFQTQPNVKLDDVMSFDISALADSVELNKDYPPVEQVLPGISAIIINAHGHNIGLIDYQIPALNMARFKRAILLNDNNVYHSLWRS